METLFAQRVRERMTEIGLGQQKELASALADATGDATSTCTAKLSKLLHDEREGRAWLDADRMPALAAALKVDEGTLRSWLDDSDERVELVLDPRLPPQAQSYLRERADRVRCVVVDGPTARLEPKQVDGWIRDEAKKLRRPLVVLHDTYATGSAAFFAGAELRTTTVQHHPRGWVLSAAPDLIPLPEPPPPKLVADDGRLLIPCKALTSHNHRVRDETPTFPLADALPYLARARVERLDIVLHDGQPLSERLSWGHSRREVRDRLVDPWKNREPTVTQIWMRGDRFFASGPDAGALRGLFAPYHPEAGCHVFELPDWIEAERARRNPWRREGEWWERVRATLEGDFGVSFDAFTTFAREEAMKAEDELTRLLFDTELGGAREAILALAKRPIAGSDHLPLLLVALSEAPLLAQSRARAEVLHVIGDVGAGWLLELRVLRFENEQGTALRLDNGWHDGGDVRVRLTTRYVEELEGSARPARARRQAARDAEDDDYDDD